MKKIWGQTAGVDTDNMKSDEILEQWIEGIRQGEMEDMAKLLLFYRDMVVSVSKDVLKDEELAKESARETMETVIRLIQKGVNTGKFEPWLMWMTRNIALQNLDVTLIEKPVRKERPAYVKPAPAKTESAQRKSVSDFTIDPKSANVTPLVLLKSERESDRMSWDEPEEEPVMKKSVTFEDQAEALRKKMALLQKKTKANFSDEEIEEEIPESESEKGYTEKINFRNAKKSKKSSNMFAVNIGMVAICTLLLWALIGLAAKNLGLNVPDLGYSWFNSHLFSLF